ncbi:hypothetical protein CRG98_046075 [Punica granatum]|uniref:Uncharacterized protein n=1 Tax=Punica granatum TaxID=22663 RepID=A0A2I0HP68_PUNGR|nr:hypothetical protein CRG98_046075 [Punica granatum]
MRVEQQLRGGAALRDLHGQWECAASLHSNSAPQPHFSGQGFALQSLLVAHDSQLVFTDGSEISHRGNHSISEEPARLRH